MSTTALQPHALPGRPRTFVAKTPAAGAALAAYTVVVAAEDRSLAVLADTRLLAVLTEDRTLKVH